MRVVKSGGYWTEYSVWGFLIALNEYTTANRADLLCFYDRVNAQLSIILKNSFNNPLPLPPIPSSTLSP